MSVFINYFQSTGVFNLGVGDMIMLSIALLLLYLAIRKQFEPLLLLPIAFGMMLANLPLSGITDLPIPGMNGNHGTPGGLLYYLYLGDELGIFPPLIFLGIGAMTDFGPLLAAPRSLFIGAAAQFGIFITFFGAVLLGFTAQEAATIGIIGGADGPTTIYLASKLAPTILASVAVAAYSYMALVPLIQRPIMAALTTEKERVIPMAQLRQVSKLEKVLFPIVVTIIVSLLVPAATTLVGMLMLGNLFRESGVVARLTNVSENALINIVTIFLGLSVGSSASAEYFLTLDTLKILLLGVFAFSVGSATGIIIVKTMNLFLKTPINPLIGSAGVSAVPMAARVSQEMGQRYSPSNFLLMHAIGPNVAGVIGSAVVAGTFLSLYSLV